jgi:hypothetical protein
MSLESSAAFGGMGGTSFTESAKGGKTIIGFHLGNGTSLASIQCIYSDNKTGVHHGATGGTKNTWILQEGEVLEEIHVRHGQYVDSICFVTNKGKSSVFGGFGGTQDVIKLTGPLVGFSGREGVFSTIDNICFTWDSSKKLATVDQKGSLLMMAQEMSDAFNVSTYSDLQITVNGKIVYLHKVILSQNPTLMSSLEKTNTFEKVSPTFLDFLKYHYTGEIEISSSNYSDLVAFCDKYDSTVLIGLVHDFIVKTMCTPENVFQLLVDAKNGKFGKNSTSLVSKCDKVISQDAEACLNSSKLLELPMDLIIPLLSGNIDVPEMVIYEAATKWCNNYIKKHTDEKFDSVFKSFLPVFRLPLFDEEELVTVIKPTNYFTMEKYLEALEYKIAPDECDVKNKPEYKERGQGTKFGLSPCDLGSYSFTITNKGLTVKNHGGTSDWNGGRLAGTKPFTKGKHFFEYVIDLVSSDKSGYAVGITKDPKAVTYVSNDPVCSLGGSNYGTVSGGTLAGSQLGDRIGILLDFGKLTCKWYKNGTATGLTFPLQAGQPYYASVHLYYVGDQVSLKFGGKMPTN